MEVSLRRRREDEQLLRDGESDDAEPESPLLPVLSKKSTIEFIQPLATAALVGITTINVLSSNGHDPKSPEAKHKGLSMFLVFMPYTMLPVGVLGLALAMIATKRKGCFLSFASGFLLFELMYVVVVGAVVTITRSDVRLEFVWLATGFILLAMMVIWSCMCTYPRFIRHLRCADWTDPSPSKKRCDICKEWTIGGKALVPAAEEDDKCPLCGGAIDPERAPGTIQMRADEEDRHDC